MKNKLISLFNKVKPLAGKAVSKSPILVGVAIGYIFKPEIKIGIDFVLDTVKFVFKI